MDCFFVFKQKTAYEMRISDWSSDVCSSDLLYRLRISRQITRSPLIVEYIHPPTMSHLIVVRIIALGLLDLISHPIAPGYIGNLLLCARQSDGIAVERIHISLQDLRRIAVRIHADKHDAHLVGLVAPFEHSLRSEEHTSALQSLMRT